MQIKKFDAVILVFANIQLALLIFIFLNHGRSDHLDRSIVSYFSEWQSYLIAMTCFAVSFFYNLRRLLVFLSFMNLSAVGLLFVFTMSFQIGIYVK